MQECVRAEESELAYFVETSTEMLLIAVRNKKGLSNVSEAPIKGIQRVEED